MKKLLMLLLAAGFGLQAAVPGEFTRAATPPVTFWQSTLKAIDVITLGDMRRFAGAAIINGVNATGDALARAADFASQTATTIGENVADAAAKTGDACIAAGQTAADIYTERLVPFGHGVASASIEVGSAGKDILHAGGYVVWAPCKFIADHPEVSLTLAASVVTYYLISRMSNPVLAECTALEKYISDTRVTVDNFNLDTISNAKARILWLYGIYTPVTVGSVLGSWMYQQEIATIDKFFDAIKAQKNHPGYINEQNVKNAAQSLKCMLARRLNVNDAQSILARR